MSAHHEPQIPDRKAAQLAHPSNHPVDLPTIELTGCPACDQPTEILRRFVLESTGGPIEHVKIRCLLGHGFVMPVAMLRDLDAA